MAGWRNSGSIHRIDTAVISKEEKMKKVLVVEDNEDSRELVCAMLEDSYEITSCADARSALALLESPNTLLPDLLLLDISLPGIDGIQLLHRIRSSEALARIPAVALTAHAMKDDESRFRSLGFDGYVTKPIVDESQLVRVMEYLIDRGGKPTS